MAKPDIAARPKEKRIKNFSEVSCGLSKKQALEEAIRCPQCPDPKCQKGCPLDIEIPVFIRRIREGNFQGAWEKIKERNIFPAICGRICPAPCQEMCILSEENKSPIAIKALERCAADFAKTKIRKDQKTFRQKEKIAVVGSGPAGLMCAAELSKRGFSVTIFEALPFLGGVLRYGIPEFRLPKKILDYEIEHLQSLKVNSETNILIGQTITIEELLHEHNAIFLAVGAGSPKLSSLAGENFNGVCFAEEFLMRFNMLASSLVLSKPSVASGPKMVVLGKTYAAFDCARIGLRMGKDVTLVCEETEDEIDVPRELIEQAKEEGLHVESLTRPTEIIPDENYSAQGVKCIKMDFADPDESGQWRLIPVKGSEHILETDAVVIAFDHKPNTLLGRLTKKLKVNKNGTIAVDNNSYETSIKGVFAAGDCATGSSHTVQAMSEARKAAHKIDQYLKAQTEQFV